MQRISYTQSANFQDYCNEFGPQLAKTTEFEI